MAMIITFNELRRIKDRLPSGSSQRIADELGIDVESVRNYFGGTNYAFGKNSGIHIEPGPDGGIVVKPRPAKALTLEISGGESEYSLQDLDEGAPFIAKVYCEGQQLTGDALKSVKLSWDAGASNAMIQAIPHCHRTT